MKTFAGQVAPTEAESSLRCSGCSRYLSNVELDRYILQDITPQCCLGVSGAELVFDMRKDATPFMVTQTAKKAEWFHATDRAQWMDDLMANPASEIPLVHVGTRETAVTLMMDKYNFSTETTYLYKVTVESDTEFHADIFADENEWPETLGEKRPNGEAYRYVNNWESTGAISLLLDPRKLKIEAVEVIPAGKVRDFVADNLGADSRYLVPYVHVRG